MPSDQTKSILITDSGREPRELVGFPPIVWKSANLAQPWYEDALREAKDSARDARRREILFAVATAEPICSSGFATLRSVTTTPNWTSSSRPGGP